MWFIQDGAPAHNADSVLTYLEETFPYRWIGTKSPFLCWPARSPDLNPLDYFFFGVTSKIHDDRLYFTKEQLQNAIIEACNGITRDKIVNTIKNFEHRLTYCTAAQGRHFENEL